MEWWCTQLGVTNTRVMRRLNTPRDRSLGRPPLSPMVLREPSDESLQSFSPHRHASTHLIDLSSYDKSDASPLPPDALSVSLSPAAEAVGSAGAMDSSQPSHLRFTAGSSSEGSGADGDRVSRTSGSLTRSARGDSFGGNRSLTVFSRLSTLGRCPLL